MKKKNEKIEVDASNTIRLLVGLTGKFKQTSKLLDKIGFFEQSQILARTKKGVDFKEEKFRSYRPETIEARQAKGLPVNKVDLFFSGKMLGSLTHKTKADSVVLYFPGAESKKAYNNQETLGRKFFKVSDKDKEKIKGMIEKWLITP